MLDARNDPVVKHTLFVAMLVFAFALPVSAAEPDAQWLKQIHRAYTGFTFGDGTLRTLTYEERAIANKDNKVVEASHVVRAGLAYRYDFHHVKENINDSTGFTGNVFWYSDQNGFTTRIASNIASPTYGKDLVFTDAIAALPWVYQRTVNEGGAKVALVRATLSNGMNIDLAVDTATGAYKRVVLDPNGDYETDLNILAYSEIAPGVKIISSWQYDGEDGKTVGDHFAFNPVVADHDLHPPDKTAHWSYGPSGSVPVTLAHDRVVVHATVNGVLGTFLIDTGADAIYLSGAFARRAHLTPIGHTDVATLYGTQKSDVGVVKTLELGDSTLHDVTVNYGMDEPDTWGPDGLLGYGVFADAYVSLDFKSSTLSLRDPLSVDPNAAAGVHVNGSFGDGQPTIPMLLNKSLGLDGMVDTGNPSGVVLPKRLLSGYGLRFYQSDGSHDCGHLDTLAVGTLTYDAPAACVAYDSTGRWVLTGMDFLRGFDRVDFDYPNGQLIFFPKKH